jgi:hypothetical protein
MIGDITTLEVADSDPNTHNPSAVKADDRTRLSLANPLGHDFRPLAIHRFIVRRHPVARLGCVRQEKSEAKTNQQNPTDKRHELLGRFHRYPLRSWPRISTAVMEKHTRY